MNHPVASVHRVLFVACVTSIPSLAFAQATTTQTETDTGGTAPQPPAANAPTEATPTQPAEVAPQPPPATPGGPTAAAPEDVAPTTAAPPPPPAVEAAPAKAPELPVPKVNIGVWLRTAMRFQNADGGRKLNDQSLSYYAELHLSGGIYDKVNYTLNFNMQNAPNDYPGTVHVLDAIAQLDLVDEFHVWMGQMLVPSDRSNFSGPFFMNPWNYPGVYAAGPGLPVTFVGPFQGPAGRNAGVTVWGDIEKGLFKYYAGAFNMTDVSQRPVYSGRLNFSPVGKEPGFYNSSSYYGDKDMLALGVAGQFQKRPAGAAKDYSEFNADLLGEVSVGDTMFTGEAAYYHFEGDANPADNAFYVLGSITTPKVGPGRLQPLFRYQYAKKDTPSTKMSIIDAQLAYVVRPYALRGLVNFQRTNMDHGLVGNAVQVGVQLMTL